MTGTLAGDAQYNGNINGIMWRRTNDAKKGYNFSYDGLNRLTAADYGTYSGSWTTSNANDMNITSYDPNGNINGLNRKDHQGNTLDNLSYTLSGNQLATVSGTLSGSYNYDNNGNLTNDGPRSLTVSYFDELNLPWQYFRNDTSKVNYSYDASGLKWGKTATRNGVPATTLYYGPFIYVDGTASKVLTSEGYYDIQSNLYHYYLKDHLGNTRITLHYSGSTPVIDQEVEYYPFGALFTDNIMGDNKYLYNGKELNNEFFENYDFSARFLDSQLGIWHVMDPKCELGRRWSPYAYAFDNPMRFVDPDGMWPWEKGGDYTGFIQNATAYNWQHNPVMAFLKDISAEALNAVGIGAIDDAIVTYNNPNTTTMDKVNATVEAAASVVIIVGEGKAPVGEKPLPTVTRNALQGKQFEGKVTQSLKDASHTNVAEQVTIKTNGTGTKFRTDQLSTTPNKNIAVTESKSSATAPLTRNQKVGHPDLAKTGGVVVGNKGAAQGYPAGTKIPPTNVDVIRPEDLNRP